MVRQAVGVAAAVVSALALGACSSSGGDAATETATTATEQEGGTSTTAGGIAPCELVDAGAAAAEIGASVTASSAATETGGQRCDYADESGTVVLGIQVELGHTPETYRSRVEAGGPVEALAAAPGDAIWSGERRALATLVDGAFVQIVQADTSVPEPQARARALRLLDIILAGLPSSGASVAAAAPFDPAGRSFDDNVLARVEDGEWTLGEGLVATLKLFEGEIEPADVLRVPGLASREGTGVILMAREYLENGDDVQAKAEIDRLLQQIEFTPAQLRAMARLVPSGGGSTQTPTTEERSAPSPTRSLAQSNQGAIEDCRRFYGGLRYSGVGHCLLAHEQTVGGVRFTIYEPAIEGAGGWADGFDAPAVTLIQEVLSETVTQTFTRLGSLPPDISIVLAAKADGEAAAMALPYDDNKACVVTLFLGAQEFSDADFKQIVAHEFGHCFQNATFAAQQVGYTVRSWREEGLAEYLSAVAYPETDEEFRWVSSFLHDETDTATVLSRTYQNVVWFHYLRQVLGSDEAILTLVRNGPTSGTIADQHAYLASLPNIERQHHDFVLATTDGTVKDLAGFTYVPATSYNTRTEAQVPLQLNMYFEAFGVGRVELTVPRGMEATVKVTAAGDATASTRPKEILNSWYAMPAVENFRASCDRDTAFLVVASSTNTNETTQYSLEVTDIRETDCEATGEVAPAAAHCLVGEWKLVLGPPFMMQKVPLELTPAMRADMVFAGSKGDVTLALREGGTFDLVIADFDETIEFRTHGIVTTSNGSGTGTWKANGDRLSVVLTGRKFKTEFGGTIGGASAKPLNAPPTYTYLWNDGRYTCSDERFGFTFPDGMSVSYVRR